MEEISLKKIFDSKKELLAKQLQKYSEQNEYERIENTISSFLDEIFNMDGEYRKNLTRSEDFIFKESLKLIDVNQLVKSAIVENNNAHDIKRYTYLFVIIGACSIVTGAIWGLAMSSWSAIWASMTSALLTSLVFVLFNKGSMRHKVFNPDMLIISLSSICSNIDSLIDTYRIQVSRIKKSYENQKESSK